MSSTDRLTADILWFEEIGIDDVPLVGGKNASLGEMYQALTPQGVWVPNGFAITAAAYHSFIEQSGVAREIRSILAGLDTGNIANLQERGFAVRHAIMAAELPAHLQQAIRDAYARLSASAAGGHAGVAVRSSATAEDLPDASFAGQQETYLNVQGPAALLDACRRCFASLYTDRAISYRVDKGYALDLRIGLSIGVERMVRSDLAAAGVMFSIDTETGFADAILINGAYGLGESVVSGAVNPDEFYVFKPTLRQGFRPILRKNLGSKQQRLIYDTGGSKMTRIEAVPVQEQNQFCISDDEILTLANWACLIEEHYSHRRGKTTPMDMEWAKDGQTGQLYIVQARPETVQSRRAVDVIETYRLQADGGEPLITGRSVGERIAHGPVRVIQSVRDLHRFQEGEILVADKTDPDWEPSMKKAAAIITNRGGRTCHAAIVSRELGLPAVVGT
jgi:pyruvate,water dikinase